MMPQLLSPVRLFVGPGTRARVRAACGAERTLIVCSAGQWRRLAADRSWLPDDPFVWDEVTANPDLDHLDRAAARLANQGIQRVLAIGGGSALDAGKALAALLGPGNATGGTLARWLRDGQAVPADGWLPLVAVPTTAGTGSEVTPFATIWDHAQNIKRSLAGTAAFPDVACVDAELMVSMSADVTLGTGLDAVNQAFESVWNRHANPLTLGLAAQAIALGWTALPRVLQAPDDLPARAAMAAASTLAGVCIAQTRTALCHAMSYPLTLHFQTPHGLACGFTMAAVWDACAPHDDGRLQTVLQHAGLGDVETFGTRLRDWLQQLGVPAALRQTLPADPAPLFALIPEMFTPGRADNLMVPVDEDLVEKVLMASVGATSTNE